MPVLEDLYLQKVTLEEYTKEKQQLQRLEEVSQREDREELGNYLLNRVATNEAFFSNFLGTEG